MSSTSGGGRAQHASAEQDVNVPGHVDESEDVDINTTAPGHARGGGGAAETEQPHPPPYFGALPGKWPWKGLLLKWQRLKGHVGGKYPWLAPWTVLLVKAGLFYLDFASDVLYAILLRENPDLLGPSNVVICVLVLPPVALSAMDLYEYYKLDLGEWVEREGPKRRKSMPQFAPNPHRPRWAGKGFF